MLTAGKDYGVEVVTAYEQRRVGQVFFPPALLRDALVRRGLVKRVAAPAASAPSQPGADDTKEESGRGRRKQSQRDLLTK